MGGVVALAPAQSGPPRSTATVHEWPAKPGPVKTAELPAPPGPRSGGRPEASQPGGELSLCLDVIPRVSASTYSISFTSLGETASSARN